jgi:hypothetical protein
MHLRHVLKVASIQNQASARGLQQSRRLKREFTKAVKDILSIIRRDVVS